MGGTSGAYANYGIPITIRNFVISSYDREAAAVRHLVLRARSTFPCRWPRMPVAIT